ncbi:MAG: hypothetical protein IT198_02600 [Acidimicrobiia bacterium]|nr:hypothetical protein [Acidimicrobiia bacterium]
MGGRLSAASARGAGVLEPLRGGASVGVFGASGVELEDLAGEVIACARASGFPPGEVLRLRFERGASVGSRLAEIDLLVARVDAADLVVVDEPDADLAFLEAVPVVDAMLGTMRCRESLLVYTTRTAGQALAADRCLRLARGRLRTII